MNLPERANSRARLCMYSNASFIARSILGLGKCALSQGKRRDRFGIKPDAQSHLQFEVQAWSLWAIPIAASLHRVEKPRKTQCRSFFRCVCAVSEAIADTACYSVDLFCELVGFGSEVDVHSISFAVRFVPEADTLLWCAGGFFAADFVGLGMRLSSRRAPTMRSPGNYWLA